MYVYGTMLKAHNTKAHDVYKRLRKNKEKEFVSLKMLRSREKLFFFLYAMLYVRNCVH